MVFKKKRDIKQLHYKEKFEQLEKEGKLDKFMESKSANRDKKRQKIHDKK